MYVHLHRKVNLGRPTFTHCKALSMVGSGGSSRLPLHYICILKGAAQDYNTVCVWNFIRTSWVLHILLHSKHGTSSQVCVVIANYTLWHTSSQQRIFLHQRLQNVYGVNVIPDCFVCSWVHRFHEEYWENIHDDERRGWLSDASTDKMKHAVFTILKTRLKVHDL